MIKKCAICGAEYKAAPSALGVTCGRIECKRERRSRACAAMWEKREREHIKKSCIVCGKDFIVRPCEAAVFVTCSSIPCRREAQRQKMIARWSTRPKYTCVICGKSFFASPSAHVRTCSSKKCIKELHRRDAAGRPHMLEVMRAGVKKSPILQPDEKHINARDYALRAPDGAVYQGRNLSLFVREHANFFEDFDMRPMSDTTYAASMLSTLRPTRKRPHREWKGWTWADDVGE